jgi:two-component system nitrogen regulation response regulator NtrX
MPNILIIDDEKAIRNVLKEILSSEGFAVDEAGDGEEGLKKFAAGGFDVILCDIKMPKVDGIEFLQKVMDAGTDTPVIMISGHGNIETAVDAVKKGAFDYIANHLILTGC